MRGDWLCVVSQGWGPRPSTCTPATSAGPARCWRRLRLVMYGCHTAHRPTLYPVPFSSVLLFLVAAAHRPPMSASHRRDRAVPATLMALRFAECCQAEAVAALLAVPGADLAGVDKQGYNALMLAVPSLPPCPMLRDPFRTAVCTLPPAHCFRPARVATTNHVFGPKRVGSQRERQHN